MCNLPAAETNLDSAFADQIVHATSKNSIYFPYLELDGYKKTSEMSWVITIGVNLY